MFATVDRRIVRGDVQGCAAVQIPHAELALFCRANQIGWLSFFGSVTRPGARIGYLAMARMAQELSDMLGRPVDFELPPSYGRPSAIACSPKR